MISEVRKGDRCDTNVAAWFAAVGDHELYLSVVVTGEIRRGVELVRSREPDGATSLEGWLEAVHEAYEDRILPIDASVADEWGRMTAMRTVPVLDGLLAATAKVHGLTLVTRNVADVEGLGASVLDPFGPPS